MCSQSVIEASCFPFVTMGNLRKPVTVDDLLLSTLLFVLVSVDTSYQSLLLWWP